MIEKLNLDDIPTSHRDIAEYIGLDAFKRLVILMGESNLYIPKETSLTRPIRNKIIKDNFDGDYKKLAKKYNITETQVRNIVSNYS